MSPPSWAYQVENFDPPPHDELICSICQCVFCEPVECSCRHVFCTACIQKWISLHRNCPICRKRTSESTLRPVNRIIKNLIMGLTLLCKNSSNGCEERMKLDHCDAHMKTCGYEMEECSNSCGKLILRKDIVKHSQEDCPFRRIKCNACELNIEGSPADHDCIAALQKNLKEKEKENDKLKEEVKLWKDKFEESTKSNIFGSSIEIDSFWSSCTSESNSSLCSSSSLSTTSSEPDMFPDVIVESSESFAVPDPEAFEQSQNYHESPSLSNSSTEHNELEQSLDFIDIASPSRSNELGASSGDDSLINVSRPRKRRLRINSSDSNTSAGNENDQVAGARKSQRPNVITVDSLDSSSGLGALYHEQTINLDSSSASASCTYSSPARCKAVSKQRTQRKVHSVNDTTSSQSSTSRYRNEPSTESNENMQSGGAAASSVSHGDENETSSSVVQIFKRTLSLLRQHNIGSDPEWVPDLESSSDSDYIPPADANSDLERSAARSHSSSDSDYIPPADANSDSERSAARSRSSSDEDELPAASCTDTESSYEVEVPTPTYDLLQRYCDFGDTDSDPDWSP